LMLEMVERMMNEPHVSLMCKFAFVSRGFNSSQRMTSFAK
jgi:hypothetical protein